MGKTIDRVDRKAVYYLAGPISGRPLFNKPAFEEAANSLRTRWKLDLRSPLEAAETKHDILGTPLGSEHYTEYIRTGVQILAAECGSIILLPGWQNSRGAQLELSVAILCDMRVFTYKEGGNLIRSTTLGNQDV